MRVSFFFFLGGFFWEFRLGYFSLSNLLALFGREEEEIRGQAVCLSGRSLYMRGKR